MTFTLIGYDSKSKEIGIISFSKALALGGIVPKIDIDIGAIAVQSFPDVTHKEKGLELLKNNSCEETIKKLISKDKRKEMRQILVMGRKGNSFAYTGEGNVSWAGHKIGKNYVCAGNMLKEEKVILEVAKTFENTKGKLTDKLIKSIEAGLKVGGDKRKGNASACLMISKKNKGIFGLGNDYINLRVDWSEAPIKELKNILKERKKLEQIYSKKYKY